MFGTPNNALIKNIRKDVLELITINERLQSALIQGEQLTQDETDLVRVCANELLSRAPGKESVPQGMPQGA